MVRRCSRGFAKGGDSDEQLLNVSRTNYNQYTDFLKAMKVTERYDNNP
jgi:hypothetical protein